MILVTLGTSKFAFNRLAKTINLYANKSSHPIIIQTGQTQSFNQSSQVILKDFYSFKNLINLTKKAKLVITHAGEISSLLAIKHCQTPPIVIPRDPRYEEHVDNQQLKIAQVLNQKKLAIVLKNPIHLEKTITNYPKLINSLKTYSPSKTLKHLIQSLDTYTKSL